MLGTSVNTADAVGMELPRLSRAELLRQPFFLANLISSTSAMCLCKLVHYEDTMSYHLQSKHNITANIVWLYKDVIKALRLVRDIIKVKYEGKHKLV